MTHAYENQQYAVFQSKSGKFAFQVSSKMNTTSAMFDELYDNFVSNYAD